MHTSVCITMAARRLPAKLHAVTLIRSGIGKPYWQKRTLEALGLTKLHKTMIHKNIPSVNGMLASVKELIKIEPVVFRTDIAKSPIPRRSLHFEPMRRQDVLDTDDIQLNEFCYFFCLL